MDLPDGTHFQVSRTTGAQGVAAVFGPAPGPGIYTFTVVGVSQAGSVYDPSQNKETTDSITIP